MSFFHSVRMVFSAMLLVFWCLLMLCVLFCLRLCRVTRLDTFYCIFHGVCCWIFNIKCHVRGEVSRYKPTLFLSNHVSYLDVFILGRSIPAYFIAKSEVAGWPVLGWLAKAQNTLFFERNTKKVRDQLQVMTQHFDGSGNLILFPEGTSTNGEYVKVFKSSLLQSVENSEKEVFIQPVTLAYTRYQGNSMDRQVRDQYAWYDTMPFASHFFNALGMNNAEVEVIFHDPVALSAFASRKECAEYCQQQVAHSLDTALAQG